MIDFRRMVGGWLVVVLVVGFYTEISCGQSKMEGVRTPYVPPANFASDSDAARAALDAYWDKIKPAAPVTSLKWKEKDFLFIIYAYGQLGDTEKSEKILKQTWVSSFYDDKPPEPMPVVNCMAAQYYFRAGNREKGAQYFKKVMAQFSKAPYSGQVGSMLPLDGLGKTLLATGEMELLYELVKKCPVHSDRIMGELIAAQRFSEARKLIDATSHLQSQINAEKYLGDELLALGNKADAANCYRNGLVLLEKKGDFNQEYNSFISGLALAGDLPGAMKILALHANHSFTQRYVSEIYDILINNLIEAGDLVKAEEVIEEKQKIMQFKYVGLYITLANAQVKAREVSGALNSLRVAAKNTQKISPDTVIEKGRLNYIYTTLEYIGSKQNNLGDAEGVKATKAMMMKVTDDLLQIIDSRPDDLGKVQDLLMLSRFQYWFINADSRLVTFNRAATIASKLQPGAKDMADVLIEKESRWGRAPTPKPHFKVEAEKGGAASQPASTNPNRVMKRPISGSTQPSTPVESRTPGRRIGRYGTPEKLKIEDLILKVTGESE